MRTPAGISVRNGRGLRPRSFFAALALLGHVFAVGGFPVYAPAAPGKGGAIPYPCQSRECGCLTSEQCWAGDCCCSTLEEKLVWAERTGVEPPPHVRPAVAARKSRPVPPKKKSCCEEPASETCPFCPAEKAKNCCESATKSAPPAVRWVAGVFAKKCRGQSDDGPPWFGPVTLADAAPPVPGRVPPASFDRPRSDTFPSPTSRPPSPPPKRG